MGILSRIGAGLLGRKMSSADLFRMIGGGKASSSGKQITVSTALEVSTVLACTRVLANGVAQVPFRVYRKEGRSRLPMPDHPVSELLYRRPNDWMTAFEFRQTMTAHLALMGNAYIYVGRVGSKREPRFLEPIQPGYVTVKRGPDNSLKYRVTAEDGTAREFDRDQIWHIRGMSWNGWIGLDVLNLARDAIGLAKATEDSQATLHRNGGQTLGALSLDGTIGPERFESLAAWLDRHSASGDRAGKPLILDRGMSYQQMQMTGVDAQHLETRRHQVEEICRALGVLPIMVGHYDKSATFASAEQMFLAHVVHTLMPWYERIEQSADINLLSEDEREAGYYTKFTPNALMRGAAKDRADYYTKALGGGGHGTAWMTPNEVRELDELDPIEGGDALPVGSSPQNGGQQSATP